MLWSVRSASDTVAIIYSAISLASTSNYFDASGFPLSSRELRNPKKWANDAFHFLINSFFAPDWSKTQSPKR